MNPIRGEVEVTLKDKQYIMRPTFDCLIAIERRTNCGIIELGQRMGTLRVSDVAAVVYEGARAGGCKLSFQEVGQEIMKNGLAKYSSPIGAFLVGALTAGEAVDTDAPVELDAQGNK